MHELPHPSVASPLFSLCLSSPRAANVRLSAKLYNYLHSSGKLNIKFYYEVTLPLCNDTTDSTYYPWHLAEPVVINIVGAQTS